MTQQNYGPWAQKNASTFDVFHNTVDLIIGSPVLLERWNWQDLSYSERGGRLKEILFPFRVEDFRLSAMIGEIDANVCPIHDSHLSRFLSKDRVGQYIF